MSRAHARPAAPRRARRTARRAGPADGLLASARASATRCCWPPDSSCGIAAGRSRTARPARAGRRPARRGRSPRRRPKPTLPADRQVREQGAVLGDVADAAALGRQRAAAGSRRPCSARTTVPARGRSKPAMTRSRVVFPLPDGPSTAVIDPLGTSRSTPLQHLGRPVAAVTPADLERRSRQHRPAGSRSGPAREPEPDDDARHRRDARRSSRRTARRRHRTVLVWYAQNWVASVCAPVGTSTSVAVSSVTARQEHQAEG